MDFWQRMVLSGAVAVTLHDTQIRAPRANGFAVLVGHDPGELVDMGEVVGSPGGQQLGKRNEPECGVAPLKLEIFWPKIQGAKLGKIFGAQTGKLI